MTHDMPDMHGRLDRHDDVTDLVVERAVPVSVEELWRWITESGRTAQWYGPWEGDGREGGIVHVTMSEEEGAPSSPKIVAVCDRPHRLRLNTPAGEPWAIDVTLECLEREQGSTVRLTHHAVGAEPGPADFGPGWEFYVGRLVAAVEGRAPAPFEEYLALADAYRAL